MAKRGLLYVIGRQKVLLVVIFILVFAAVYVGSGLLPPVYRAKAAVLVARRGAAVAELDRFYELPPVKLGDMVQKLSSPSLLQKTLDRLGYNFEFPSAEFQAVRRRLRIRQVPATNVLEVVFFHFSPRQAAETVNTLLEIFKEEDFRERQQQVQEVVLYLKERISELRQEQAALLSELKQMEKQAGSTPAPGFATEKNRYLRDIDSDLRYAGRMIETHQAALTPFERDTIKLVLAPRNPVYSRYKRAIENLERQLAGNLFRGGWENPQVKEVLVKVWRERVKMVDAFKKELGMRLRIDRIKGLDEICAFQVKMFVLQIRRNLVARCEPPANREKHPSLQAKQRELAALADLERSLIGKLAELEKTGQLSFTEISWLNKAVPPQEPFFPNTYPALGLSFLVALFCCFVSIIIGLLVHAGDDGPDKPLQVRGEKNNSYLR